MAADRWADTSGFDHDGRLWLEKLAPLHRQRNSVADALLIELYGAAVATGDVSNDSYAFVTSNHDDFSQPTGDRRVPHPDIATMFEADNSSDRLGVEGLVDVLRAHFEIFEQLVEESDFLEEPRRLEEIVQAEHAYFEIVWFNRSIDRRLRQQKEDLGRELTEAEREKFISEHLEVASVDAPYMAVAESDFEWGMWNGKLSTLRWVLGSEWDFLDT